MQTKVLAKAVLLDENGRVLLLRRSSTDDRRPGEQDFPGGGMEPSEEFTSGVSREILEEAGLVVPTTDLHLFFAATQLYDDESVTRLLYYARVHGPGVKLSYEHDDFHWVSPEQALLEFPHPFYGAGLAYGIKHKLFGTK